MVKDHSNNERRKHATATTWANLYRQESTYHGLLLYQSWNIGWNEKAQWVHHEGLIQPPIVPWTDVLPQSYVLLLYF